MRSSNTSTPLKNNIARTCRFLIEVHQLLDDDEKMPKKVNSQVVKVSSNKLKERFTNQKVHRFLGKQLQKDTNINTDKSNARTVNKDLTSHLINRL